MPKIGAPSGRSISVIVMANATSGMAGNRIPACRRT
jgi:hypothetical protein